MINEIRGIPEDKEDIINSRHPSKEHHSFL
jgi:hypothetical protein